MRAGTIRNDDAGLIEVVTALRSEKPSAVFHQNAAPLRKQPRPKSPGRRSPLLPILPVGGGASSIEIGRPAFIPRREIQDFLPRYWETALRRQRAQFSSHVPVMIAV